MGDENGRALGFFKTKPGQMGAAVGPQLDDPIFLDSIIFTDRVTGKLYEVSFSNGEMQMVEVTIP